MAPKSKKPDGNEKDPPPQVMVRVTCELDQRYFTLPREEIIKDAWGAVSSPPCDDEVEKI
jgi:hypothetical protein